jgi:hypothetical protein
MLLLKKAHMRTATKNRGELFSNPGNILYDMKELLSELPLKFREITCNECSWSFPSYYRKMRQIQSDEMPTASMSNAEISMIYTIMDGIMEDFINEYNEYKEKRKNECYNNTEEEGADPVLSQNIGKRNAKKTIHQNIQRSIR